MEKLEDLEYIDLKNSLDGALDAIKQAKRVVAINMIVAEKFEEEIKKYPKPKLTKVMEDVDKLKKESKQP